MYPSGDSPDVVRWISLLAGIIAILIFGLSTYQLIHDTWTGSTTYTAQRFSQAITVAKASSPEKYSRGISQIATVSILSGGVSLIMFAFFRKLS